MRKEYFTFLAVIVLCPQFYACYASHFLAFDFNETHYHDFKSLAMQAFSDEAKFY